ncbi:DNL zinc finger-domain-containing protein [Xylaria palmicola]|nr:DNL zinc finger-domain-containing protein [Xylaria palmicola]
MASRIATKYLTATLRAPTLVSPSLLRPYPRLPRTIQPRGCRFAHAIPKPTPPTRKELEPHYQMTFTCVPCGERSSHVVSKQGYHKGSVLITCSNCRNRHVISDHLNIFGDRKITLEDLLREKGQLVKRGTLGELGDVEFWADTLADSADGTAGAAPVEGGEDDAGSLREARNPSPQATDPTPTASGLSSDAGARPSLQSTSEQRPIPSTRRQYTTGSSRRPSAPEATQKQGKVAIAGFGPRLIFRKHLASPPVRRSLSGWHSDGGPPISSFLVPPQHRLSHSARASLREAFQKMEHGEGDGAEKEKRLDAVARGFDDLPNDISKQPFVRKVLAKPRVPEVVHEPKGIVRTVLAKPLVREVVVRKVGVSVKGAALVGSDAGRGGVV